MSSFYFVVDITSGRPYLTAPAPTSQLDCMRGGGFISGGIAASSGGGDSFAGATDEEIIELTEGGILNILC